MENLSESSGYHEIRLEHRQILFVFLIAAGIGVVLFLLGVWVGRVSIGGGASVGEVTQKVEAEQPKPLAKESEPSFYEKPKPSAALEPPPKSGASETPTASTSTPVKKPAKQYFIQVISLSTEEKAKAEAQKLEHAGFSVTIDQPSEAEKSKYYKIFVGGYATKEEALAARKRLEGMNYKPAFPRLK